MSHSGPGDLIGVVVIALVLVSLWRQLLALFLGIIVVSTGAGLYQIVHFMGH